VILRERDANTSWMSASDGTLEERRYYCQNWRADVSAIITSGGVMVEWTKYSPYGIPFGLPGADTDSDGDCDATDISNMNNPPGSYDVRYDVDLDGDNDATDKAIAQTYYQGTTYGWDTLSSNPDTGTGNRKGYAGYEYHEAVSLYHIRNRVLHPELGRWTRRDPLGYVDGMSVYEYVGSRIIPNRDSSGLVCNDGCKECTKVPISNSRALYNTIISAPIWPLSILFCPQPCPSQTILNDPQVKIAMQEAEAECGCKPSITCSPLVKGGFALPGIPCPMLFVGCNPTATTVAHELRHAWQYCKYPATNPFTMCQEMICREIDAYSYTGQCNPSKMDSNGNYECCFYACASVDAFAGGVCNLLNDCMDNCNKMMKNGWCSDGHYGGPLFIDWSSQQIDHRLD